MWQVLTTRQLLSCSLLSSTPVLAKQWPESHTLPSSCFFLLNPDLLNKKGERSEFESCSFLVP